MKKIIKIVLIPLVLLILALNAIINHWKNNDTLEISPTQWTTINVNPATTKVEFSVIAPVDYLIVINDNGQDVRRYTWTDSPVLPNNVSKLSFQMVPNPLWPKAQLKVRTTEKDLNL